MFSAGVRAHYHASQLAARAMITQRRGLIVNISSWAGQKYIGKCERVKGHAPATLCFNFA
jgi:NAD(P)-dependent dehydrogenase (short-subunit alcohol dehydrogenase family)